MGNLNSYLAFPITYLEAFSETAWTVKESSEPLLLRKGTIRNELCFLNEVERGKHVMSDGSVKIFSNDYKDNTVSVPVGTSIQISEIMVYRSYGSDYVHVYGSVHFYNEKQPLTDVNLDQMFDLVHFEKFYRETLRDVNENHFNSVAKRLRPPEIKRIHKPF